MKTATFLFIALTLLLTTACSSENSAYQSDAHNSQNPSIHCGKNIFGSKTDLLGRKICWKKEEAEE